jgi:hypothetical protein
LSFLDFDYRGPEPEEPPLPLRLLSRLRTGVDAVRSIIDRARADGQQLLGNTMIPQVGEDAARFSSGGGRSFAQYSPQAAESGRIGTHTPPSAPASWGPGAYQQQQPQRSSFASMFDASSMESQRQFDWGGGGGRGAGGMAEDEASRPAVTGAARIWGRIRSLLAPPGEEERKVETYPIMPLSGPLHYYSPGPAESPLQGGRANGGSAVDLSGRPEPTSGRYQVGMESPSQPGQEQVSQLGAFGGAYSADRYPDSTRPVRSSDTVPAAWDRDRGASLRPEALQPLQMPQSGTQSNINGPATAGPKVNSSSLL